LSAYPGDVQHRSFITNLALASSIDRPLKNIFWISNIDFTSKNNEFFINSSGATVIVANKLVSSGYDADISYDVSEFYRKNNNRAKFISNFLLNKPNTIFSIGFDSGVSAEKIKIEKNLFLGLTHVFQIEKRSNMVISFGSWFGGRIKESPCYDLYDREYWCQNLTSWADYKPAYPKNLGYVDFRFFHRF
jgi:hypothetical protein